MDIIWDGERLFVAGPDTTPSWSGSESELAVGVRFRPGIAPLFLRLAASELRDQRVDLDLVWSDAGPIVERLAECQTPRHAASILEKEAAKRLPGISAPDPVVEAAARVWSKGAAIAAPDWWAQQAGISERHLHRRFLAAVGYGPKLLQRILRLQKFLQWCQTSNAGLAELAATSGYADQAHLTREARALTGLRPTELRASRLQV
jgi:AraC-like DNA-binding protein